MNTIPRCSIRLSVLPAVVLLCFLSGAQADDHDHGQDHGRGGAPVSGDGLPVSMKMHHMHVMAIEGLAMALRGSNLVTLGWMNMAPPLDQSMVKHGREMIRQGREMIREVERGADMKDLHEAGLGDDPRMKYTHDLLNAMEEVLTQLEKAEAFDFAGDAMTMHHMHITLNHALEMATEGATLVMLGQMRMSKGTDEDSIRRGRELTADARKLSKEVTEGKAMKQIHARMMPATVRMMKATHNLAEVGMKVMELLEKMPDVE